VVKTILDVIERENLVHNAAELRELTFARLRTDPKIQSKITEVRGRGLMIGIQLKDPPERFLDKALGRGLVVNLTAKQVVRLAPAINIPRELWIEGLNSVVELIASL